MLRIFIIFSACFLFVSLTYSQDYTIESRPVLCSGGADGEIHIRTYGTSADYTIKLLLAVNNKLLSQQELKTDTLIAFRGLKAQSYKIQFFHSGVLKTDTVSVKEPAMLKANIIEIINYPSSAESCDGSIKINPTGGTPPYTYWWNNSDKYPKTRMLENLCQGIYRCILSDANNCGNESATVYLIMEAENVK